MARKRRAVGGRRRRREYKRTGREGKRERDK